LSPDYVGLVEKIQRSGGIIARLTGGCAVIFWPLVKNDFSE